MHSKLLASFAAIALLGVSVASYASWIRYVEGDGKVPNGDCLEMICANGCVENDDFYGYCCPSDGKAGDSCRVDSGEDVDECCGEGLACAKEGPSKGKCIKSCEGKQEDHPCEKCDVASGEWVADSTMNNKSINECGKCNNGVIVTDSTKITDDCHECNGEWRIVEKESAKNRICGDKCCDSGYVCEDGECTLNSSCPDPRPVENQTYYPVFRKVREYGAMVTKETNCCKDGLSNQVIDDDTRMCCPSSKGKEKACVEGGCPCNGDLVCLEGKCQCENGGKSKVTNDGKTKCCPTNWFNGKDKGDSSFSIKVDTETLYCCKKEKYVVYGTGTYSNKCCDKDEEAVGTPGKNYAGTQCCPKELIYMEDGQKKCCNAKSYNEDHKKGKRGTVYANGTKCCMGDLNEKGECVCPKNKNSELAEDGCQICIMKDGEPTYETNPDKNKKDCGISTCHWCINGICTAKDIYSHTKGGNLCCSCDGECMNTWCTVCKKDGGCMDESCSFYRNGFESNSYGERWCQSDYYKNKAKAFLSR